MLHTPFLQQTSIHNTTDPSEHQTEIDNATLAWADETSVSWFQTGENQQQFTERIGLRLRSKHIIKTGKRLRRLFRPHKFPSYQTCHIIQLDDLDPITYDGFAFINADTVKALLNLHAPSLNHALTVSEIAAAQNANRYNLTYVGAQGQLKGHAIAMPASTFPEPWDIAVPPNSYKSEIALINTGFLAIEPVKAKRFPKFDIQSLINMPWVTPALAQQWTDAYNAKLVDAIRHRNENPLSILDDWTDEHQMNRYMNWWLGEYITRGGKLTWFRTTITAIVNTMRSQLAKMTARIRLPMPGWYLYIAPIPPIIGELEHDQVKLDIPRATLWVNPDYYREHMPILGGCDADDALWTIPINTPLPDLQYILAWRSPNQPGEYIFATNTNPSQPAILPTPTLDQVGPNLLPRIDQHTTTYLHNDLASAETNADYTNANVLSAHLRLTANAGILGAYCNILMAHTAITKQPPAQLPAPLEVVIDGTVKDPIDLTPVKNWIDAKRQQMRQHSPKLPLILQPRINTFATPRTTNHRLDQIQAILEAAQPQLDDVLLSLNADVQMPSMLTAYQQSPFQTTAKQLRNRWQRTYRLALQSSTPSENRTRQNIAAEKADHDLNHALDNITQSPDQAAIAALVLAETRNQSTNWLTRPTMWPHLVTALIKLGLLAEVGWIDQAYADFQKQHVPTARTIKINGVWFNLHKLSHNSTTMSDMTKQQRQKAKLSAAKLAPAMASAIITLSHDAQSDRQLATGPSGKLIGYVDKNTPAHNGNHTVANVQDDGDGNWYVTLV